MENSKREKSTLRKNDEYNSKAVTEWLEQNFYQKFTREYQRMDDLANQFRGVDCVFKIGEETYFCDEKAAVAYVNKPLFTFSFELSFINRNNKIQDGWFVNKNMQTNSYLLAWIDKAIVDSTGKIQEIHRIDIALVKKLDLYRYLEDKGWSESSLKVKDNRIRTDSQNENLGNLYKNGCKFTYSQQLVEKPINILIPKTKLLEMSIVKFDKK